MDTIITDVLVIGAGAAGIRAALDASEAGLEVLMVAEGNVTYSGSTFSSLSRGWGVQALVWEERTDKNLEEFYDDIMRVGLGRCDPKLVQILVEESGSRFEDLISYGVEFKKDSQGKFIRIKGCFSESERAFVTEDLENIKSSFLPILSHRSIQIIEGTIVDLIVIDNECWGAWAVSGSSKIKIESKATILATGGGAGIFTDHFVADEQTGDGYALAHRAGAAINNLEFIQFMLGLKTETTLRFLPLSDLYRPNLLCDAEGSDLLEKYIMTPKKRTKAIKQRQKHFPFSCRDSSFFLDISAAQVRKNGKKVFYRGDSPKEGQTEVVHFAHAFNGGVKINENAESTLKGLFAAGEVAAGPHGADRIGGCMITATQIFGQRAGEFAALRAKEKTFIPDQTSPSEDIQKLFHKKLFDKNHGSSNQIISKIREEFSQDVKVLRNKDGLTSCLKKIREARGAISEEKQLGLMTNLKAMNMLLTMELITTAALEREESLGAHYRGDFPPQNL